MPLAKRREHREGRPTGELRTDRSFDDVFRRQYPKMVRLAYMTIGDNARAEEVVQDAFLDTYRSFDDLREPEAYLRVCVVNRCRSELRRRRVRELHPPEPPPDLSDAADELWDVLGHLTEEQRIAVVLRYHGQFRSREIAEIMEIPASTVRYHLRTARQALRQELAP